MNENAKTYISRSTSSLTMEITPILLRETKTTRLLFYPVWVETSDNPLRGGFLFQKKSPLGVWEAVPHLPLSTLKKDENYSLTLNGDEVVKLLSEWGNIQEAYKQVGFNYGVSSVRVVPNNVDEIIVQISDPEKKQMVEQSLKALDLNQVDNLGLVVKTVKLDALILQIENNMHNNDESFWQNFFENNPDILQYVFAFPVIYLNGETYVGGSNTKGRHGAGGVATDHLIMNATNNSFAVIEIKTPTCNLTGSIYRGKAGSGGMNELYSIHADLSGGVVQLEEQIHVATKYFQSHLGEDYDNLNMLNPCGVLVAGNKGNLSPAKLRSFNLYRKTLGKNQIFTYDEILMKLKLVRSLI